MEAGMMLLLKVFDKYSKTLDVGLRGIGWRKGRWGLMVVGVIDITGIRTSLLV